MKVSGLTILRHHLPPGQTVAESLRSRLLMADEFVATPALNTD